MAEFLGQEVLKYRVVLLAGDEEYLRRQALDQLLAAAIAPDEDFDSESFDGGSSDPPAWTGSVSTVPFLSERRTAVVRHVLQCDLDRFEKLTLAGLPSSALLVLVADEESGDDSRQQRLKTAGRKWEKLVNEAGGLVYAPKMDTKAVAEALRAEAVRNGKTITQPALDTLIEMTGGKLSRAIQELEKIALYIGNDAQIREGDIKAIVVPSREWNIFNLVDAILRGAVPDALRQLKVLTGNTKVEDAAFRTVQPMLLRNLRLVWQARMCVEAKVGPDRMPPGLLAQLPSKPNLAQEKGFTQSKTMGLARGVTLPQLERCFELLSDADARLKGILPAFSAAETLEQMVLEMVQVVKPTAAAAR